jgi:hypothetical protein
MLRRDWIIQTSTEDDCIEYIRCLEQLEAIGVSKMDQEIMALNCHTCVRSGMCSVKKENMFLGAKTC